MGFTGPLGRSLSRPTLSSRAQAGLIAVILVGAACGNPTTPPTVTQSTQGAVPVRGGTLTLAIVNAPANFDSQLNNGSTYQQVNALAMEGLVRFKPLQVLSSGAMDPSSGSVEGSLAESWQNPSATVWTFTIAAAAHWQNIAPVNGRAVTANDVVATFGRILKEENKSPYYRTFAPYIASVEGVDSRTVKFSLKTPFAALPRFLATGYTPIYPNEGIAGQYDLKTKLIGSGPFQLDSFQKDRSFHFVRNPSYWKAGLPYLDVVDLVVIPDTTAAFTSLMGKQLDIGSITNGNDLATLKKANGDAQVRAFSSFSSVALHLNPRKENAPFDDARVRQAVRYAVDQDELVQRAWGGDATFSGIIGPISIWGLSDSENRALFKPDLEKARSLLTQAGYLNGIDTSLIWCSCQQIVFPLSELAQVLASQLAKVGIRVQLKAIENAPYQDGLLKWTHKGIVLGGQGGVGSLGGDDPQSWLNERFGVNGQRNWAQPPGAADPKLQSMLDQISTMQDEGQRRDLAHQIERYIADLGIWVGVGAGHQYDIAQADLRGYQSRLGVDRPMSSVDLIWRQK